MDQPTNLVAAAQQTANRQQTHKQTVMEQTAMATSPCYVEKNKKITFIYICIKNHKKNAFIKIKISASD